MKKTTFIKSLLLAAALTTGASAWAEDTYDLVWEEDIAKVCTDWGASANGTVSLVDNGNYKNVSVTYGTSTHDFNTNLAIGVGRPAQVMCRFAISSSAYNAGLYYNWNATSTVAVLNAKKDQIITIRTTSNTVLSATNATANASSATEYSHTFVYGGKTRTITYFENAYTVTADGVVTFSIPIQSYIGYVGVTKIHEEGVCDDPTYSITGANYKARTFTLNCTTEESSIYYSTTELTSATGGLLYSGAVETEASTIWAYAKAGTTVSNVVSFSTGAGSTLSLATPTITASGFTNSTGISVNEPTFSFLCNNNVILGKPEATLSYTFTPYGGVESSETTGNSFKPTTYGTLKVIASADGYNSTEKSIVVSNMYTISYTGRDYTTATHTDGFTTWGDAYNVDWSEWANGLTSYLSTTSVSDDYHLNIQNASTISLVEGWGWVRGDQKAYGYRARYAKEGDFIAFKENSSKGADPSATTYQTAYCQNGTGVITDLVTITVPAGYALQQLYHYSASPNSVTATITDAGWATLYTNAALDFSGVEGLTAYTATYSNNEVTLTEVNDVPANTGVVLKGAANEYDIPVIASSSTNQGDLQGSTTEATSYDAYPGFTLYMLNIVDEKAQFVPVTSDEIAAGKAFLKVSNAAGIRSLKVVFSGDATGINAVNAQQATEEYYNLRGQRVAAPQKGLYIVNGKKVVVK